MTALGFREGLTAVGMETDTAQEKWERKKN